MSPPLVAPDGQPRKVYGHWTFTLVHGTWGRGFFKLDRLTKEPKWFEEGSRFVMRLRSQLLDAGISNAKIEVCRWSGANSIAGRDEGARRLADQLSAQKAADPATKQIVIAHSHGGNVALRSLAYWPDTQSRPLLVTLATPFLEIFPPDKDHFPLEKVVFLMIALFLTTILSIGVAVAFAPSSTKYVIIGVFAFSIVIGRREVILFQRRRDQAVPNSYVDRLAEMTSLESFKAVKADLLVLRGVDDEAGLSIAAGALGRRLALVLASVLMKTIGNAKVANAAFCLLLLLLTLPFWPDAMSTSVYAVLRKPWIGGSLAIMMVVGLVSLLLMMLCYAVAATCLAAYGRELFFRFLNAEISFNSVPDSSANMVVHTLLRGSSLNLGRLRHSLYDELQCTRHIVSWAEARFAGKIYAPADEP